MATPDGIAFTGYSVGIVRWRRSRISERCHRQSGTVNVRSSAANIVAYGHSPASTIRSGPGRRTPDHLGCLSAGLPIQFHSLREFDYTAAVTELWWSMNGVALPITGGQRRPRHGVSRRCRRLAGGLFRVLPGASSPLLGLGGPVVGLQLGHLGQVAVRAGVNAGRLVGEFESDTARTLSVE